MRVHSIEMNCFTEKTGNKFSEEDAQYSEEYEKMIWMREAIIRTCMQLELEACQEEIAWMITCHNCEALNRPLEEYPARPLPIPPNYIDNLHSRLIKRYKAGRPGSSEVPRNPLTRWDVSSIPANGIFLTKKLKNKIKMPNGWRTIKSLVHKIRLHGRRGKGMAESFSREKLRHAPQKEGG